MSVIVKSQQHPKSFCTKPANLVSVVKTWIDCVPLWSLNITSLTDAVILVCWRSLCDVHTLTKRRSNSTQNSLVLKRHMTFVNGIDMSVQLFSLHLQNSADGPWGWRWKSLGFGFTAVKEREGERSFSGTWKGSPGGEAKSGEGYWQLCISIGSFDFFTGQVWSVFCLSLSSNWKIITCYKMFYKIVAGFLEVNHFQLIPQFFPHPHFVKTIEWALCFPLAHLNPSFSVFCTEKTG